MTKDRFGVSQVAPVSPGVALATYSRIEDRSATLPSMKSAIDRAVEALLSLPEDLREREVRRLEEQVEKLVVLRRLVKEGLDDVDAGRVDEWNVETFLAEARSRTSSE